MKHADNSEQRIGTRSSVIFDEDVLDEARGLTARSYSADAVRLMRKELERYKKDLVDALNVEKEIAEKYSELQRSLLTWRIRHDVWRSVTISSTCSTSTI